MSEIESEFVKRGFWINWSKGHVLGATLTVDNVSGAVLIALLAILVSLAVDHLWNLILFLLHQSRAAIATGDGLFQQEQVLLRMLPTPFLLLIDLVKVSWAWRSTRSTQGKLRLCLILLALVAFSIAGISAGIFSSYIVTMSDVQVLVSGDQCFVNFNPSFASLDAPSWLGPVLQESSSYAQACYAGAGVPTQCNVFVQPRISFAQENITCPFATPEICAASTPVSVTFDSGLINSHDALGINDRPGNRILVRRRTTYTPISTKGYVTMLDADQLRPYTQRREPFPGEEGYLANYGPNRLMRTSSDPNATLKFSTYTSNVTIAYTTSVAAYYLSMPNISTFAPIPEITTPKTDTILIFVLGNNIASLTAIDDPVFSTHRMNYCQSSSFLDCSQTYVAGRNFTFMSADSPFGAVIASQQYQVCLPDASGNPSQCTELIEGFQGRTSTLLPSANEAQRMTLDLLATLFAFSSIGVVTGAFELQASRNVVAGLISGLPRDQWVIEAQAWESFAWAAIQTFVTKRGHGMSDNSTWLKGPSNRLQQDFCGSQKVVKTGGFANVNVFGLCVVITVSVILIFTDVFLLKVVIFFDHKLGISTIRIQRWIQDGVLQLQRRAYEADGVSGWHYVDKEVPVLFEQEDIPSFSAARTRANLTTPPFIFSSSMNGPLKNEELNNTATRATHGSRLKSEFLQKSFPATGNSFSTTLRFANTIDDNDRNGHLTQGSMQFQSYIP